jgi:protein-S-isoprenylcysteine O-methyltransferase Ste14
MLYNATAFIMTLFNVSLFAWGVQGIFRRGTPDWRLWVLKVGAVGAAVVQLGAIAQMSEARPWQYVLGISLLGASCLLFGVTARTIRKDPFTLAFSTDAPRQLVQHGPYRWIRHPFYTSYMMTYVAGSVLTMHALVMIAAVAMGGIYVLAARMEEAKFLSGPLGGAYRAYRDATGAFLPRLVRLRSAPPQLS